MSAIGERKLKPYKQRIWGVKLLPGRMLWELAPKELTTWWDSTLREGWRGGRRGGRGRSLDEVDAVGDGVGGTSAVSAVVRGEGEAEAGPAGGRGPAPPLPPPVEGGYENLTAGGGHGAEKAKQGGGSGAQEKKGDSAAHMEAGTGGLGGAAGRRRAAGTIRSAV
ncbi:hypothetical protein L7F22_025992 [Adiantum nelumboides]|nr:hypothetical protein [Adiantum nelumboides]